MTAKWAMIASSAVFMLPGCATPAERIATELTRFGLSGTQASCVGERLEARLSVAQLQQLASAAKAYSTTDSNPGQLTATDLTRVSAQIKDPRIPIEVATAGASCGILGNILFR